ncbi:gluconate transporter [Dokdonia pacifica]|uniref:Gnt-I system low-affinity gluconate transporter n=1 Tax=Dokdonia pacifica TaxID=1627892 RepID=A0A239DA48_9FLAO|nr:gluconate:H+ symporter [Dokdonia pacifica]GGG40282.1 gluconate transporter [Dokdonia pacifica]SNS28958.1 Gnt-I system low-affinity gluconate transporter [Dokdonia pacifica]
MDIQLLIAVTIGISVLLFLILRLKFQAFIALLITCIVVGVIAGMDPIAILDSVKNGMGGTLGFVATVVGLGALFGAILERSGGAQQLAQSMLQLFGVKKAHWAVMLTGFLVAIPVFFDVAFIILVPLIYALQKQTKKSLLLYAIPLLAGLAITHTFIPPTPGPIAVADILGADLGYVIIFGFLAGLPAAIIAGPILAKRLSKTMHIETPSDMVTTSEIPENAPSAVTILLIIAIPILLIVCNTVLGSPLFGEDTLPKWLTYAAGLLGHPFVALIIANIVAWYVLGINKGFSKEQLLDISTKSLYPAGVIILLTGAGGAFKQILIDTGAGEMIAKGLNTDFFPPIIFGFIVAAIIRILQGSATVAMITAAGITYPLLSETINGEAVLLFSQPQLAVLVIAIASGATVFSHVNDSGFWLVKQYLGLTEKETFRSWTVMTTLIALIGLVVSVLLWYLV